ncbi:MAG: glycosyltransferase family 2 protein [Flavobacteriaceae bacterium]
MPSLISVIIPCYNQGRFLKETCDSLLAQNYSNWEAIIVNDGSTDNTEEVAEKIIKLDTRFKYFYKKNGGLSSARNFGINKAVGDYIQFLDSDDILKPDKFSKSIKLTKNNDVVITDFLRFKSESGKLKKAFCNLSEQNFTFKSILLNWDVTYSIPIHCGMFKRTIIESVFFDEELKAKEDWFFWLQVFERNPKVTFLNEKLALYRVHKKSMTKDDALMHENLNLAYNKIYAHLSERDKGLFFSRLIRELSSVRQNYKEFKDNVFYRKIFYSIKKMFNN